MANEPITVTIGGRVIAVVPDDYEWFSIDVQDESIVIKVDGVEIDGATIGKDADCCCEWFMDGVHGRRQRQVCGDDCDHAHHQTEVWA